MADEVITSVQNPLVKRLGKLLKRKGREETGTFLVEGAHLVEEALRSDSEVLTVIYDQERGLDGGCARLLQERAQPVKLIAASPAVIARLSETKTPQGVLAEVRRTGADWERWWGRARERDFFLLMLDEIQDPGNLGTIIRTADAAGVDAVILGEGSVDVYNGKVVRATMGSLFRLPVFTLRLSDVAADVKAARGRLLVTSLASDSQPYDAPLYAGKLAIVIGNEGRGVSPAMLDAASARVHIPLYGGAESLNAAVASGIVLYEAQRQRRTR